MPSVTPWVPVVPEMPALPDELPWPPDYSFDWPTSPWYYDPRRPDCYNDFAERMMRLLYAVAVHRASNGQAPMFPPFDLRYMTPTATLVEIAMLWLSVAWNTHTDPTAPPPEAEERWRFAANVSLVAQVIGRSSSFDAYLTWDDRAVRTTVEFKVATTAANNTVTFVASGGGIEATTIHIPGEDKWRVWQDFPPSRGGDDYDYFGISVREMVLVSTLVGTGASKTKRYYKDGAELSNYTGENNYDDAGIHLGIDTMSTADPDSVSTLEASASFECSGLLSNPELSEHWPLTVSVVEEEYTPDVVTYDVSAISVTGPTRYYVDGDENELDLSGGIVAPIAPVAVRDLMTACPLLMGWLSVTESRILDHLA